MRIRSLAVVPQATLYAYAFLTPVSFLVAMSFSQISNFAVVYRFTLHNYRTLLSSETFWIAVRGSVLSSAAAAICAGFFAFPITLYLVLRASDLSRLVVTGCLLLPLLTNSLIRAYSLKLLLASNGVINVGLIYLGILSHPIQFLYTVPVLLISYIFYYTSLAVLTQWAGAGSLSQRYLDISADLGARPVRRLLFIVLPLCTRGIALQGVVVFAFAFSDIIISQVVGSNRVYTLASLMTDYFTVNNWPMAAAVGVTMVLIILPFLGSFILLGMRYSQEQSIPSSGDL